MLGASDQTNVSDAEVHRVSSTQRRHTMGFLVVGMLLGIAAGFAPLDVRAAVAGYNWASPDYVSQTIVAMIVGGAIGLTIGGIVDSLVTKSEARRNTLRILWLMFAVGVLAFPIIRGALERARE